ncbi:MAG: sulfoxide reductase heme-binding subunit YedZ [Verrucomicrobiales bacterium]|jgi:sulfoxide reductase heme-binding subunit YedZ
MLGQIDVAGVDVVEQIWWFTSRAAGIVAWVLLSLSVIVGMSISTRDARRMPTGWPLDLHRFMSMLSLTFLGIHLTALVPDNFIHFGLGELFVPMLSEWQPGAIAWGIVAFWLVVTVEVTSLVRSRLPYRLWRRIHMLSFVVWVTATVHLFLAGSDVSSPPFRIVQALVISTVVVLFVRRLSVARRRSLPIEKPVDVDQIDAGERRELSARRR